MSFLDAVSGAAQKVGQGIDKFANSPTLTRLRAGADLGARMLGQQPTDPNQQGLQGIRNDLSYLRSGTRALKPLNPNKPLYAPGQTAEPGVPPQGPQGLYGVL